MGLPRRGGLRDGQRERFWSPHLLVLETGAAEQVGCWCTATMGLPCAPCGLERSVLVANYLGTGVRSALFYYIGSDTKCFFFFLAEIQVVVCGREAVQMLLRAEVAAFVAWSKWRLCGVVCFLQ